MIKQRVYRTRDDAGSTVSRKNQEIIDTKYVTGKFTVRSMAPNHSAVNPANWGDVDDDLASSFTAC